jgi:sugar/nucleoside kinase (ribokinase family)
MRHGDQRPAEPVRRNGSPERIDLVLIGHVGCATDRTPHGTTTYTGGSGFATAFAAATLLGHSVGLVAQVGQDFDLADLRLLPLDTQGVAVRPGNSAAFFIDQSADGSLLFRSDLGVAAEPGLESFPAGYFQARYVHLGTAPPRQQQAWLRFLRDQNCRAQISVDMFEPFVAAEPDICRQICDSADLIFLNQAEYRALYQDGRHPPAPTLLKHGRAGAEFLADGTRHWVAAPQVAEVHSIGAGEILAGAFLALRTLGFAENRALSYAVSAAAHSVTEFGVAGPNVTRELNRVRDDLAAAGRPPSTATKQTETRP